MLRIKLMTGVLYEGETYEDIFGKLQNGFFGSFKEGEDLPTFVKNYVGMVRRMFERNVVVNEPFSYEQVASELIRVGIFFEEVPTI